MDIISHDLSLTDLGLRQPRLEEEEYLSIVDEFMEAVFTRWPKAIVQVLFLLEITFNKCILSTSFWLDGWPNLNSLKIFKWSGLLKHCNDIVKGFACSMMTYRWVLVVVSCYLNGLKGACNVMQSAMVILWVHLLLKH